MQSQIYLDESGDLGFKFDNPYRNGGSSRYLTLGYLICPITHCHIPKRIVRDVVYHEFGFDPKKEMKASFPLNVGSPDLPFSTCIAAKK